MSFKTKFLILYSLILVFGFVLFFVIGFKLDKWFTGWVIFGCITIIPNLYYFSVKAKIDNKKVHKVVTSSNRTKDDHPRILQSLLCIGVSICFGPAILLASIIATLLGATI